MSERKPFTPEERASFLGWRFGSTLDWASLILVELGYPVEQLRWWVDAVQGICQRTKAHYKDAGVPISHSTLAKRARRFKNKAQASELVRRAIAANAEWSHLQRVMIFDVERPTPAEKRGRDKRACVKYTDYLTGACVWAQECEQSIKKADPAAWKSSKYRGEKRREILLQAIGMLPSFGSADDMPPDPPKSDPKPQTLSEYVAAREARELAERRRIIDRIAEGQLIDADEIDERLAVLETYYARNKSRLEKEYSSTRNALLAAKGSRLVRAMDFTDPAEVAADVDSKLGSAVGEEGAAGWLQDTLFSHTRGNAGVTPSVQTAAASAGPFTTTPSSGSKGFKGNTGVTPIREVKP